MKSRLVDGGGQVDPALKDGGARAVEGVGPTQ